MSFYFREMWFQIVALLSMQTLKNGGGLGMRLVSCALKINSTVQCSDPITATFGNGLLNRLQLLLKCTYPQESSTSSDSSHTTLSTLQLYCTLKERYSKLTVLSGWLLRHLFVVRLSSHCLHAILRIVLFQHCKHPKDHPHT